MDALDLRVLTTPLWLSPSLQYRSEVAPFGQLHAWIKHCHSRALTSGCVVTTTHPCHELARGVIRWCVPFQGPKQWGGGGQTPTFKSTIACTWGTNSEGNDRFLKVRESRGGRTCGFVDPLEKCSSNQSHQSNVGKKLTSVNWVTNVKSVLLTDLQCVHAASRHSIVDSWSMFNSTVVCFLLFPVVFWLWFVWNFLQAHRAVCVETYFDTCSSHRVVSPTKSCSTAFDTHKDVSMGISAHFATCIWTISQSEQQSHSCETSRGDQGSYVRHPALLCAVVRVCGYAPHTP